MAISALAQATRSAGHGGARVADGDREGREARRLKVFLNAHVQRFGAAEPTRHRVRDLSSSGACIDQADGLRAGATLLMSVGALDAVGATVVWVKEGLAGIRFATPVDTDAARANSAVRSAAAGDAVRRHEAERRERLEGWMAELRSPYRKPP